MRNRLVGRGSAQGASPPAPTGLTPGPSPNGEGSSM